MRTHEIMHSILIPIILHLRSCVYHYSLQDLSYDATIGVFNATLSDIEMDILADYTVISWYESNINDVLEFKEALQDREFKRRGGGKWNDIIKKMWSCFEFPDKSECNKMIIYKQ